MIQTDYPTPVPPSQFDEDARIAALPKRKKSNWRDVLGVIPAKGTRVEMSTGRKVTEIDGTGKFSSLA